MKRIVLVGSFLGVSAYWGQAQGPTGQLALTPTNQTKKATASCVAAPRSITGQAPETPPSAVGGKTAPTDTKQTGAANKKQADPKQTDTNQTDAKQTGSKQTAQNNNTRSKTGNTDNGQDQNNNGQTGEAAANTQVSVTGMVTDTTRTPVRDVIVEASNPDTGEFGPSVLTDAGGCYTLYLDTDKWLLTFWKLGFQPRTLNVTVASTPLDDANAITDVNLNYGRSAGEFYRIILGLQQSGASSSTSTRKLFGDLYFDIPAKPAKGYDLGYGPRWRFWGNLRITSVPESAPVQLSQFNLGSQVSKLNTSQLAQSVAFNWGPEFRIFGHPPTAAPTQQEPANAPYIGNNNNSSDSGSFGNPQKFTGSLFASFGAATPLNPQESATLVNGALPGAQQLYKDITGNSLTCPAAPTGGTAPACVLALLSKDRTRFPKEYFIGFRLKTHYFTQAGIPAKRPPAMFDVGVGQNALITQGTLHGLVMKIEAFYPLPFQSLQIVYLFGRTDLQLTGKSAFTNPYILAPDTSGATITSSNVQTLTLPNPNRDTYEIGIGMDMLPLVSKLVTKTPAK